MFKLRNYQEKAVDALYDYWRNKKGTNPLIVAPTGSGKTAIIAQIVKDAMSYPGTRVLILTHVRELLEQGADGLKKLYPEADIGFYSASLNKKNLSKSIIFGGIQSIYKRAYDIKPAPDLIIIDEAHMVPPNTTTRYGKFIDDLKICNPDVKIVGLTATPYRLGNGYLFKGQGAIFDGIAYDIQIRDLINQGYLSPVISRGGLKQIDLTNVKKRGGEFVEKDLAIAASDSELVRSTVEEIITLGKDRKSWLIFSSGIKHAYLLQEQFLLKGINAEVIIGQNKKDERDDRIKRFKEGKFQCLINVNVLTTGFDAPNVDLIGLVRATASTSLYVQIIGRGTRLFEGKKNCLILDYGGNVMRHGFVDKVNPAKEKKSSENSAPVKTCPSCQEYIPISVFACPSCGYEFPPSSLSHDKISYSGSILSMEFEDDSIEKEESKWLDVNQVYYSLWKKKGKPDSIKATYFSSFFQSYTEWLCPEHGGYPTKKYKERKKKLRATAETTSDALLECHLWSKPRRIKIIREGKYDKVLEVDYHIF